MALNREILKNPEHKLDLSLGKVSRDMSGTWKVEVRITGTVRIDATRALTINRLVTVARLLQEGRKVGSGRVKKARAK